MGIGWWFMVMNYVIIMENVGISMEISPKGNIHGTTGHIYIYKYIYIYINTYIYIHVYIFWNNYIQFGFVLHTPKLSDLLGTMRIDIDKPGI